jgi:hypothetical protein
MGEGQQPRPASLLNGVGSAAGPGCSLAPPLLAPTVARRSRCRSINEGRGGQRQAESWQCRRGQRVGGLRPRPRRAGRDTPDDDACGRRSPSASQERPVGRLPATFHRAVGLPWDLEPNVWHKTSARGLGQSLLLSVDAVASVGRPITGWGPPPLRCAGKLTRSWPLA